MSCSHRPHSLFLWWITLELIGFYLFKRAWANRWVKTDQRKSNQQNNSLRIIFALLSYFRYLLLILSNFLINIRKCIFSNLFLQFHTWQLDEVLGRGDNRACYSPTQTQAGSSYSQPFSTTLNSSVHQNRTQGSHKMQQLLIGIHILITILVAFQNSLPLHLFGTGVLVQLLCDGDDYENDINYYNNDYYNNNNFIWSLQGLCVLVCLEHVTNPKDRAFPNRLLCI